MYIIHMDIHQTNDQLQQLENRIGSDEDQQEGDAEDLNKTEAEKKLQLRLELEFETIDDERKDAMDVEEIKFKEQRMMKGFVNQ
jgi:predicted  nucleic acid-binding Zn-ribbon protein